MLSSGWVEVSGGIRGYDFRGVFIPRFDGSVTVRQISRDEAASQRRDEEHIALPISRLAALQSRPVTLFWRGRDGSFQNN